MPTSPTPRCIGVILAAGRGRRMGRTKQLIELATPSGTKPLVAAAYDAIRPICTEIVIVLSHEADAVAAALGDRPFQRVLSNSADPMFESIRVGLAAARQINPIATIALQPGDHPEVSERTLQSLVDCSLQRVGSAIIPEYGGRGGHPVLIPPAIVAQLLQADCPEGLGQFWSNHPELCFRLPTDDASIVRDIDTPGNLVI